MTGGGGSAEVDTGAIRGAPREPPEQIRSEGIARNTLFTFLVQMTTAAFTAVLTVYLARALEPSGYGTFALAVSIGALILLPADVGLSQSVARFVAERRDDPSGLRAVISHGLRLKVLLSGVACVAIWLLASPIAEAYGNSDLTWPLRWVGLVVFGQGLMGFYSGAFIAVGRVSSGLRMQFGESAVETAASIALVAVGAGAAGAALGRAAGYCFGAVAGALLAARLFGRPRLVWREWRSGTTGLIARYAGALLIIDAAFAVLSQIDSILIGAIIGSAAVGQFSAVMRLLVFLSYFGLSLSGGIAPRLARRPGHEPDVRSLATGLRLLILLQAALVAPVIVWARPIVDLVLGPGYEVSAQVLRAVAPIVFLGGFAPLLSLSVNYLGEARRRVPIMIGVTIFAGVSLTVLLETVGLLGAAYANDATFLLGVAAHLWICNKLVDLDLRPLAVSLVRAFAAAGAMALVLLAFGTKSLTLAEWILGAVAGGAAYVAVLFALHEVTFAEVRDARRALPGLLRQKVA